MGRAVPTPETRFTVVRAVARLAGVSALTFCLVLGCASSPDPELESSQSGPAGEYETAEVDEVFDEMDDKVCVRDATVTVHVWNQGSAAVQLGFGPYKPVRRAEGFERTDYKVARPHLDYPVRIRIARGGLQLGPPAEILTEAVVCNDAVLVIGARPRYSVFYGDMIYSPSDLREAQEGQEEEAPADSAAAGDGSEG